MAQFISPQINFRDREKAKVEFLKFQKCYLLETAATMPEVYEDIEEAAFLLELSQDIDEKSFGDIVDELDFPRVPKEEDPIRILAEMPISIYITTGYYDFIERELRSVGKIPRSLIFPWHDDMDFDRDEKPLDPDNPIVYHLFGMEEYIDSLVLSEDDYIDFFWMLAKPMQEEFIKSIAHLLSKIRRSRLLLLGYRLQDWDFRVLLRGFLRQGHDGFIGDIKKGVAIHVDLSQQDLVHEWAGEEAEAYLKEYFAGANFQVEWNTSSDEFIINLNKDYQAKRS